MATIVNEGTKDYRVTRNSIYVGSVVKLKNGSKLTDDLSVVNCEKYRTILFDDEGKTYVSSAYGIYNSLRQIISIFGNPSKDNIIKVNNNGTVREVKLNNKDKEG